MTFQPLLLKPGIDVEKTPLLNSAGFSFGDGVRFFQGLPQKAGGWTALNGTSALTGICRGMLGWADLLSNPYIACGSSQMLGLFSAGAVYDITPLRATTNPSVSFSTASGSPTVTIRDTGHGALAGDRVIVAVPVSVGGIVVFGTYVVASVVDTNNYTVTSAANATSTVAGGGAVPVFNTTLGSVDVTVTLANHGQVAGAFWNVQVSTAVGGFTLSGSYIIASVTDSGHFIIRPGGAASSTATVSENSGNARLQYLVHTGAVDSFFSSASGYGAGAYGAGPYGVASSAVTLTRARQWFLDHFGQDLVGNYNGSPLYVWVPPYTDGNRALQINVTNFPGAKSPPTEVNVSFVSDPQQMVIALGCDDVVTGTFDPNLVRWCNVGDFTDWFPTTTNQAGSFRIPSGSRLVGGISAPNFIVIWTDVDMWLMSYLGGSGLSQFVWSFNKLAQGVDLIAPRAAGVLQSTVYWPSYDGFYSFDGQGVHPIQCPVWDKFWFNLDQMQIDKVNVQVSSIFNEVSWGFPSASGSGEVDKRITMRLEGDGTVWTYDDNPRWARTAWIDDNIYGAPVGSDTSGLLQQHETSNDANGTPLPASVRTGWFSVAEGTIVSMMERLMADLTVTGGSQAVSITVYTQDYPTGPVRTYGPFPWNPSSGPPFSIVRARGRYFSFEISSSALGVFWRLGRIEHDGRAAGGRP